MKIKSVGIKLLIGITIFFINSCVPPATVDISDVNASFRDTVWQRVYTLQEKQDIPGLLSLIKDKNPSLRYGVAMAFASLRDSSALDSIYRLLGDRNLKVIEAAAYALGQIGSSKATHALMAAYDNKDSFNLKTNLNATILEAIGKCGTPDMLNLMASISTFNRKDSILLLGQMRGLYRYGLRGIVSPKAVTRTLEVLNDITMPSTSRMMAANYLAKVKNIKIDSSEAELFKILSYDKDPDVRMAVATSFQKIKTTSVYDKLKQVLKYEKDFRVKVNILNTLKSAPYENFKFFFRAQLNDKNPYISRIAAEYFVEKGIPADARWYWTLARDTLKEPYTSILYTAASKSLSGFYKDAKYALNAELKFKFDQEKDPYIKAQYIRALGASPFNFRLIRQIGLSSGLAQVRTTSIEVLADILKDPAFYYNFGAYAKECKRELIEIMAQAIMSNDVGLIAVASEAGREPKLNFKLWFQDFSFMQNALNRLKLPRDLEAYQELDKLICFMEDTVCTSHSKKGYTHPLDWRLLNTIKDKCFANIETNKGNIVLELLPEYAPASVANFIQLTQSSFFNNKLFHRVVPNFVIQTGCPRGDGYGSLNYTIRSELPPLHYDKAGYVGMASAGNHTECSQWFITQSPTPHLDGNYTIFAKVVKGMDVVDNITIGDIINKITIQF